MLPTLLTLTTLSLLACKADPEDTGADDTSTGDGGTPAEPVELAYDDGTSESNSSPWGSEGDGAWAVRFTPSGPVQLVALRYFVADVWQPTTPFQAVVWAWDTAADLPGSDTLYSVETAASQPDGWLEVELSGAPVELDGDFAVGMIFTTPPGMDGSGSCAIGSDESEPDGRSYGAWSEGAWGTFFEQTGIALDFMIRAVVVPLEE